MSNPEWLENPRTEEFTINDEKELNNIFGTENEIENENKNKVIVYPKPPGLILDPSKPYIPKEMLYSNKEIEELLPSLSPEFRKSHKKLREEFEASIKRKNIKVKQNHIEKRLIEIVEPLKYYSVSIDFDTENEGYLFDSSEIRNIPKWIGVYIYVTTTNEKYVGSSERVRERILSRNEMLKFILAVKIYPTRNIHDARLLEKKLISILNPELNRKLKLK